MQFPQSTHLARSIRFPPGQAESGQGPAASEPSFETHLVQEASALEEQLPRFYPVASLSLSFGL